MPRYFTRQISSSCDELLKLTFGEGNDDGDTRQTDPGYVAELSACAEKERASAREMRSLFMMIFRGVVWEVFVKQGGPQARPMGVPMGHPSAPRLRETC